ncbi:hypothetical protein [Pedococcus bigeumensis]|uniref:Uncharacterized protein n=1 Tax=Pedococcus bigeumensis TaxID=433644 RepID=A0A502CUY8_9MICO|nr:hypothetical protein [Pedococcus bigeumensis]TPG17057.1 hypothetical protein EAH86_09785 [Pedococcus bigeumensis]
MGKGFEIEFDKNFGRNLEREVMRMAQGHIDGLAKEGTRAADRVLASHGGQPVEVVKSVLQRELKRAGLDITGSELTRFAQQISDGGRVVIESDHI